MNRPKTRILLDGGDPEESAHIRNRLGFLDGQTTNPSLVAKNPEIVARLKTGHQLSEEEALATYRQIVTRISPLVDSAGVSIEVYADFNTTAEEMLAQGRDMFTWIPNAYIKYPCTAEGLRAASLSVAQDIRVNMTLCFSQAQAAAVYAATKGTQSPVYVSPFVGRLDDIGINGMNLVENIRKMFIHGDGHVLILAASLRSLEHLLYCFSLETDLVTAPEKVLDAWAARNLPVPAHDFVYESRGIAVPYEDLDLTQPWQSFNIEHELTRKGIEKFVADYHAMLRQAA